MRNVICAFNVSIDGNYDHTKLSGNEELHQYFADLMKEVDLGVTERKMYELMEPHWKEVAKTRSGPKGSNDFADTITSIPAIVVSTTMPEIEGGPRIIRGNVEEEIRKLKAMPGKKISIGGMSLRTQLMKAGLIDELYLVVQPFIVGKGPHFMEDVDLEDTMKMELVDTKIMQNGCVAMHYLKR